MTTAFKKAFDEWFDNFFIFEFGLNLFLILLFVGGFIMEVALICFCKDLGLYHAIFNPFMGFTALPAGWFAVQYAELVVKYLNVNR